MNETEKSCSSCISCMSCNLLPNTEFLESDNRCFGCLDFSSWESRYLVKPKYISEREKFTNKLVKLFKGGLKGVKLITFGEHQAGLVEGKVTIDLTKITTENNITDLTAHGQFDLLKEKILEEVWSKIKDR